MKIQNIILIILSIFFIAIVYKKYQINPTKDSNILIVGTSADYPPYEFIDTKTLEIIGFDIDVITQVAQYLNKKVVIKNMPFTSLIFALLAGDIDVIVAGMSPSIRRAKFVQFTDKYLSGDYFVILSKKDKFIPQSLSDLVGKRVVVNSGHTAEAFMAKQEGVQLIRLKDVSLGLVALQTGTADAFICSNSVLNNILQKKNNTDQFSILPLHGTGDDCAFAVKLNNTKLVKEINQALTIMHDNNSLKQLKIKWNVR
jgi:polar amino acid transport system substrate-binding protein